MYINGIIFMSDKLSDMKGDCCNECNSKTSHVKRANGKAQGYVCAVHITTERVVAARLGKKRPEESRESQGHHRRDDEQMFEFGMA